MKLKSIFVWVLLFPSILKIVAADDVPIDVSSTIYSKKKDAFYQCFESPSFASLGSEEIVEKVLEHNKKRIIINETIVLSSEEEHGRQPLNEAILSAEYNFNCYLEIYYANVGGKVRVYYGSGALIAPNIILTTAHNLYNIKCGGYPDRIDCFAACLKNEVLAEVTLFPKKFSSSVFIHPEYKKEEEEKVGPKKEGENYETSKSDIGLIIFDQKTSDKFKAINFAIPYQISEDVLQQVISKKKFTITGYSKMRKAYSMTGKLVPPTSKERICYDIDTAPGQSGSGICFNNHNDPMTYCIGVHVGAFKEYNFGVLIDEVISDAIKRFIIKEN